MGFLEDELDRQKEENRLQHEQILALQAKLQDTELRLHKVSALFYSAVKFNNNFMQQLQLLPLILISVNG